MLKMPNSVRCEGTVSFLDKKNTLKRIYLFEKCPFSLLSNDIGNFIDQAYRFCIVSFFCHIAELYKIELKIVLTKKECK